jgi:hypothetical protein
MALHFAAEGTVGKGGEPTVFKPPGYPVFGGLLLRAALGAPPFEPERSPRGIAPDWQWLVPPWVPAYLARGVGVLHAAQLVCVAAAAALLFLWLARLTSRGAALTGALLFGANPGTLAIAGTVHYAVLHLTLIVAGGLLLQRGLDDVTPRRGRLVAAGVVWGLATLVRPIALLLPPVAAVAIGLLVRPARRGAAAWSWLVLGMALVVAPYAARNLALSGRLIPVNAQAWAVLFSATARKASAQPNHFRYKEVREEQMEVQSRVAARTLDEAWEPYDVENNLALESAYRAAALENLRQRPGVYLYNLGQSTLTLLLDMPTIYVDLFCRKQRSPHRWPQWYWPGTPQDALRTWSGGLFLAGTRVLTALGALGLWIALRRRDRALLAPLAVAVTLGAAHALTWMDVTYYYVKLPFLVIFGLYGLDRALGGAPGALWGRTALARLALGAVLVSGLAGTVAMLVWSR